MPAAKKTTEGEDGDAEGAGELDGKAKEEWAHPTEGHEQKGRRQVLIVSPEAFNRLTRVPVVVPITSGASSARSAGFAVPLTGAGTKTTGVVRCDQPRALDLKARGGRKLEEVPVAIVEEVLAKLAPIFE